MKYLNKQAESRYDEIIEWFEERPGILESFLRTFALENRYSGSAY